MYNIVAKKRLKTGVYFAFTDKTPFAKIYSIRGIMENIIKITGLKKYFKDVKAVDGLDFCVKKGELFAFLGVNGAGKSTTISMICGQLEKDEGEITVCGKSIEQDRAEIMQKIGVVFQNSALDQALTVKSNLESRAALYGISGESFNKRLDYLSDLFGFKDLLNRTVGKLSGGQRRRIDVARALIHEPETLILDEPTTGLDPQTRKLLWNVINGLRKDRGLTVFLTTHYMEETADADYVVILDSGKIVAEGTPLELKNAYTGDYVTLYNLSKAEEEEVKLLGFPCERLKDGMRISVKNTAEATELILKRSNLFKDYEIIKGKMDDVFLAVTGKKIGGDE